MPSAALYVVECMFSRGFESLHKEPFLLDLQMEKRPFFRRLIGNVGPNCGANVGPDAVSNDEANPAKKCQGRQNLRRKGRLLLSHYPPETNCIIRYRPLTRLILASVLPRRIPGAVITSKAVKRKYVSPFLTFRG